MTKYAHIDEIRNGVVFSDPWYDENVWCQYRCAFADKNWFMKLETRVEDDVLLFQLDLGRPTMVKSVEAKETEEGYSFRFPEHYIMKDKELGIDSARIYLGNMKNFNDFGESIAIHTGGDGGFGDLFVYTVKGEEVPSGFILFGAFDNDFMTEEQLFNELKASFDGKELNKEAFMELTSEKLLANRMLLARELQHAQSIIEDKNSEKGPELTKKIPPER